MLTTFSRHRNERAIKIITPNIENTVTVQFPIGRLTRMEANLIRLTDPTDEARTWPNRRIGLQSLV